jgi:hypothetical protein
MLRHACGYTLANKGIDTRTLQAYLGHRSINSTTGYAAEAVLDRQKPADGMLLNPRHCCRALLNGPKVNFTQSRLIASIEASRLPDVGE